MSAQGSVYNSARLRPVEAAGQGRCLARRGERVRAVDQQRRRADHPRLRRLLLIGDLAAADHRVSLGGARASRDEASDG